MTEFLVALAALLPLFIAVAYVGRYGDIAQTAVAASRYAAFERTMVAPGLPDTTLRDQMRARFFLYGGRNNGRLQSDDTATRASASDSPPVWRDLTGSNLLASPNDVSLQFGTSTLGQGTVARFMGFMTSSAGKSYGPASVAQVEVNLANHVDLSTDRPGPLRLAAATAVAADGLGSSGSQGTRDAAATIVPLSHLPSGINTVLGWVMRLFEPEGPQLGCVKPDVVPNGRLDGYAPPGPCL
jgi:hypothetical protein